MSYPPEDRGDAGRGRRHARPQSADTAAQSQTGPGRNGQGHGGPGQGAPSQGAPGQGGSVQGGPVPGGEGGWPARYGPRPDFTLPPDNVGTQPGPQFPAERPLAERPPAERPPTERPPAERPAAGRPGRHSSAPGPSADPADSGWFTSPRPYEGARRNGP